MASELQNSRIGFLGGGAMGEALAAGVLASGVAKERIWAADPDQARRKHLEEHLGIATSSKSSLKTTSRPVV